METISIYNIFNRAKNVGCTHYRIMYNNCSIWKSLSRKEAYSIHFFCNDIELCYCIYSENIYKHTGLIVLHIPRVWDSELLNNPLCGELLDIDTIQTRKCI